MLGGGSRTEGDCNNVTIGLKNTEMGGFLLPDGGKRNHCEGKQVHAKNREKNKVRNDSLL